MSLTRMLNKTPLQNEKTTVYETELTDSLIAKVLHSRFVGEGVYAFEQFSVDEYQETYLSTPSFDKVGEKVTEKQWNFMQDMKDVTIYELLLEKPHFMPLDTDEFIKLFQTIAKIKNMSIFTQVLLCKRTDVWREMAISAYESYLKGNDHYIDNKLVNKIQEKCLNVLAKVGNFEMERQPIEEIERKILQNNYRFECRFVVYEGKFPVELEKMLEKLRLFNGFELKKVRNKKELLRCIENRQFQPELVNQLLSEEEVCSLLCESRHSHANVEVKLPQVQKKASITQRLEESLYLQRAIQLLPYKESKRTEIDETIPQQVNNAFKRVGIVKKALKIVDVHVGSSLLKVQMEVPTDITFTSIKKKVVDIQAALGNEGVSIEIGEKPDTINIFVPLQDRDVVYFRNVLESTSFQEFRENSTLPFIIGESSNGGYMFGDLAKMRHLLIAGTSGSGKSVYMVLILLCLLLNVPPTELNLYLIDPKMVEFSMFDGFPQTKEIITDMNKANTLLSKVCKEMDRRYEVMSKVGVKDIATYNQKMEEKLQYVIVAVDELADLMMVNSSVEDYIVRIAQKGRAAGIHLILATQRPSVDVVTGLIKANMPARFAFAVTSATDSRTIIDKGGAEKLLGLGDGLAKIEGSKHELERFQAPLLTLDQLEEEKVYEQLKGLFDDVEVGGGLPEIVEEDPIDKLKRIITSTNELRVTELARLMEMGNNKVHGLMQELLQEGWLRKEGRSYEINVDEEELRGTL